jgi:penicillin amidase
MNYQMDIVSPYAREIIPYLTDAFSNTKITDDNLKLSLELLKDWDFKLDKFSQAPSIYLVTFKYLLENTFKDEMGNDLFNQYVFLANIPYRVILQLLNKPNSVWWNNINTKENENRDEIIRKCFSQALTYLEENVGSEVEDWQWGKIHQVKFKHPFSGNLSLMDKIIDIGPYEVGGDGTTIFNTEYPFAESIEKYPVFRHDLFENDLGPSLRYIYDFSKPDEFHLILTTGQSGNVMSDHFSDMSLMWLTGKYMKISTDKIRIKKSPNRLLVLTP